MSTMIHFTARPYVSLFLSNYDKCRMNLFGYVSRASDVPTRVAGNHQKLVSSYNRLALQIKKIKNIFNFGVYLH